jgi:hypothetical protein
MKVKVLKKLICCASYSLIYSNGLVGATPVHMMSHTNSTVTTNVMKQAVGSMGRLMGRALLPVTPYSFVSLRYHSNFHGSGVNNQGTNVWGGDVRIW